MKFFVKILCVTILVLNNTSLDARAAGAKRAKQAPQKKQTPVSKQPVKQQGRATQPATRQQQQTYKDLVAFVKTNRNAWDSTKKMLSNTFIDSMLAKARELNLEDFQLEALLKTARDMHGVFSGNQNNDIAILQSVDQQITNAVQQL